MAKEKDELNECGHRNSERVEALKELPPSVCPACLLEQVKELKTALESIWPFIEEDFPKGTGDNHGTCATDKYVEAARILKQALKG